MGLMQKVNRNHLDRNGDRPPEVDESIEKLFNEFYGTSDEDDENDDADENEDSGEE